jgi:hypothetical protein
MLWVVVVEKLAVVAGETNSEDRIVGEIIK